MINEETVHATIVDALDRRRFDDLNEAHEPVDAATAAAHPLGDRGGLGDDAIARANGEWSIFATASGGGGGGDEDDEIVVPSSKDTTLVVRSRSRRFCRSLAKDARECLNKRMRTHRLAGTAWPSQLLVIANKANIRTKKVAFLLEPEPGEGDDDDAGDDDEAGVAAPPRTGVYVRIVAAESLMYNVLNHELVPEHVPLDAPRLREITAVYRKNRVDADARMSVSRSDVQKFIDNCPVIGTTDPVVVLLGGVPAEASASGIPTIYEIQRPRGDIAYRVVVGDFGL